MLRYSWELASSASAVIAGGAPTFISSALQAQKETEGTNGFAATAASGLAGATLLSWVGIRTALFAGPVTGNNSNTHVQTFSQPYGNGFTNYSLKGFRCYTANGSSNHSVSGVKGGTVGEDAEEVTTALVVLSGGTIVDQNVVSRVNAGAGATLSSGSVTLTQAGILVAVCSGDGNVSATAPTQTWPGTWTVRESVAFNSAQAPNGHVPLYVGTREVAAGTYSLDVQMTIDEGATFGLYAVQ